VTATETFWEFSLRTYSQAGVADACLTLQDEYAADVNLLLYCCWAGWRSAALDQPAFELAVDFSRDWAEHVVRPLRKLRRWMKSSGCHIDLLDFDDCMKFREKIKATELGAEKLQQAALESLPLLPLADAQTTAGPQAVAANLRRYCDATGIPWSDEVRSNLGVILRAAFPKETHSELSC
jgi:uncharacterized protein (TIGR02444 family)